MTLQNNVIPFPRQKAERIFCVGDTVRLTKSDRIGTVIDVRPDFGVKRDHCYEVLTRTGTIAMASGDFMETVQ